MPARFEPKPRLPDLVRSGLGQVSPLVKHRHLGRILLEFDVTTFERPQPNAIAQLAVWLAFGLVKLAVAAGFEPAEGCPSRAFEFCGWWFRPVRLGPVPPEPRLGSPLRTPLNLHE
jgi:hypothetical protein